MTSPAFQLYTKDFDCDEHVMLMTCEQEGAYFRLLRVHWREGSVPADVGKLALLCRLPLRYFETKVWPALSPCFVEAAPESGLSGRLLNPRMDRERQRLAAFRAERAASGAKGNAKRWARNGIAERSLSDAGVIAQQVAIDRTPYSVLQSPTATDLAAAPDGAPQALGKSRDTWLTPYLDAWRERWGAESVPPIGEMARAIRQAEAQLKGDRAESVERWRRFLEAAEASQFARPARFVQGLGEWAAAAPPGVARGRGVTAGNVAAAGRFLQQASRACGNA